MLKALMSTNLPLPNKRVGKVRDLYDLALPDGGEGALIIATDRISVFDVVLANGIPGKGVLLTGISTFWFRHFEGEHRHHLLSTDVADIPGLTDEQRRELDGRVMICRKAQVVPVECIVRGYLAGSGYKDYLDTGEVCGIPLPAGLVNGDKLEQPIFTPSTKAQEGHDQNVSFDEAARMVGRETMESIRDRSIRIYASARDYAASRGIIIADTKFEFGLDANGELTLIDEALTPDSSRFWPADDWRPGREQSSFDKQYVRDYAQGLADRGEWNKEYPGPALPDDVITNTLKKYREALRRLADPAPAAPA